MKKVLGFIVSLVALFSVQAGAYEQFNGDDFQGFMNRLQEDIKVFGKDHAVYEIERMQGFVAMSQAGTSNAAYEYVSGVLKVGERTAADAFLYQFVLRVGCYYNLLELESNTSKLKTKVLANENIAVCSPAKFLGSLEDSRVKYLEESKAIASQESFKTAEKITAAYDAALEQYKDVPSVKDINAYLSSRKLF